MYKFYLKNRKELRQALFKCIIRMKIILFIILISLMHVQAKSFAQKVNLSMEKVTLRDVLDEIQKQTGYDFLYNSALMNKKQKITLQAKNRDFKDVLTEVLQPYNFIFEVDQNIVLIRQRKISLNEAPIVTTDDQQRKLTGIVGDTEGRPLSGVTVAVKGTSSGTVSDSDGRFSIAVEKGGIVVFSLLGYTTKELPVPSFGELKVELAESLSDLDEVVVIGYGTARKIDLTGSTSSLGGDQLRMKSTPQLSSQMQGQMAGVQITRSNGDPSAGATVRVRGVTTMSTNDPLVIVDGVPGTLTDVAPEDVKDIQVLKDAASAAIYGSRAAAGVILVTTKRARNNEFHLSYNGDYGIDAPTAKPKFANAVQWMSGLNELAFNDGASSPHSLYSEDMINNYAQLRADDPDRYADTDFMGMGLRSSTYHQRHGLSLTGGTEKLKTSFGLNYFDSEGLMKTKDYERFNIRNNNDYTINNWIHANVDLNLLYANATEPHATIGKLMERAPIYNAFWTDGRYADGKDGDNPIAERDLSGLNKKQNYRAGGKLQLDLTPLDGLTLTAIVAPQFSFYKGKDHKKRYEVYRITGDPTPGVGYSSTSLSEARDDSHSLTKQFYANYKLQLQQHSIGLMGGYEDYSYKWENEGASRTNYSLVNFPYLNLGPEDYQFNSGSAGHNAYRSFFGRIMYSWSDRYLLQGNIRSDGSSRFAKGHRWGTFPSASAGWIISEEPWFKKNLVDFLKLRGSIGQLGNERIGSEFPYQAKLSFGTGFIPNASTGVSDIVQTAYQTDYAFNTLTWETTTTYGLGADISLLRNRLRASGDYYYKKTTDMLMEVGFPSYFGYNAPQNNAADMNTKGWDFEIAWSDQIKDFRYGASFNLSDYRSRMGYMADRQNIGTRNITEKGSYYNEWYGYRSLGIILNEAAMLDGNGNQIAVLTNNDKAGNIRYQDIDGDGKITASNDRVRLGNSLPEMQYGGSLWAEWKNFDFNLSFQGIGHQLVYWTWPGTPFNFQAYASPLNLIESRWSPNATDEENAKAKYPKLTTNSANIYANSDFYLFDGSYMRIKNITLGYTIPPEVTKKVSVSKLRVYFSANDLPAFSSYPSGYDPEWNRSGDLITSSYIFGLNVSF